MAKKGRDEKGKFIEGHDISVGNNGGRPLLFPTPELLEEKCNSYFEWADANPWIKNDVVKGGDMAGTPLKIPTQRPYTLIGLCHHIGLSLNGWKDYEERPMYSTLTTRVRERIENQQIEGALVGAFNANLTARLQGISDKKEIQGEIKTSQIDLSKLDEETLRKLKDSQKKALKNYQ